MSREAPGPGAFVGLAIESRLDPREKLTLAPLERGVIELSGGLVVGEEPVLFAKQLNHFREGRLSLPESM